MRILVIGEGAREHAIAWKIAQSTYSDDIYIAPGNSGTEKHGKNVSMAQEDLRALASFAEQNSIDLTIVGPEVPLASGIADSFAKRGLRVFGPSQKAAQIESSKVFAKQFMQRLNIPTAPFLIFDDPEKAIKFIETQSFPIVIKTDGLAGGKGAIVAANLEEAKEAIVHMMIERTWGDAGKNVVVEQFLPGIEVSVLAMTDGENAVLMLPAQDYKRAYEGNQGPNTGGMGAIAPHPKFDAELKKLAFDEVIMPTIEGLNNMGMPFKGILYAGLMLTRTGPKVLEFNCRFGDPETSAILPLLKSDLLEMILFALEGRILEADVEWHDKKAVCVVMASGGYPRRYKKGYPITGLTELDKITGVDTHIFHAGTSGRGENILTNGGRVLNVVGLADSFTDASQKAYSLVRRIEFEKSFYRTDIALEYK